MESSEKNISFEKKLESQKNPEVYHFAEFGELEGAFIDLIKELKEEIENNTYDTLISDDVGGRLPTLALREVIKKQTNKPPDTFFLPFGRDANQKNVQKNVEGLVRKSGKTLLVTEYVMTGRTLRDAVKVFDEAGLNVDVAVPFSARLPNELKETLLIGNALGYKTSFLDRLKSKFKHIGHNHQIFIGLKDTYGRPPNIDLNAQRLAGVDKNKNSEGQLTLRSQKKIARLNGESQEFQTPMQIDINEARADAKLLAKKAVEQVWGKIDKIDR